jgi:hypothetical protein
MIDVNVTIAESFFAWMVMVVDEKEQGTKYLNFLFIARHFSTSHHDM